MAEGNKDPLFTLDFGQVLAKLHLAGIQAIGQGPSGSGWAINTGVDNSIDAKPDSMPKDFVFDLKSKDGMYEFGLFNEIEYQQEIQEKFDTELNKLNEQKQKILDDIKKLPATDTTNAEKKQKDVKDIDDKIEARKEALKTENETIAKENEKKNDELKKKCFDGIKKYFTVFAGKDNASKITESELVMFEVSKKIKDNKDKNLVKDSKIVSLTDVEIAKQNEDNMKIIEKNSKAKLTANYGYKVGFTVDTDAM